MPDAMQPLPQAVPMESGKQDFGGQRNGFKPHWRVVCAEGVVVRKRQHPTSQKLPGRLPAGAVVVEEFLAGERLFFTNRFSSGPESGWVTVGTGLLEKVFELNDQCAGPEAVAPPVALESLRSAPANGKERVRDDKPLGGWAALAGTFGQRAQEVVAQPLAACAAETYGRRRSPPTELPPIAELESLDAAALASALGLDDAVAAQFAGLSRAERRKMIAEAKALIEMSPQKQREFVDEYRRAWPRGPFRESAPPVAEEFVLPPGTCFPLSRHLQSASAGPLAEWGLGAAPGAAARGGGFLARRAPASPEAQKEYFRSLGCEVLTTGDDVAAGPGVGAPQAWQVEGHADKERIRAAIMAKAPVQPEDVLRYFNAELKQRICLLDGSMAARLDQEGLEEVDYRGERFRNFREKDAQGDPISLKGNLELLVLTKPGLITDIHKEYLLAGADIIRTNTVGCNAMAQRQYKTDRLVFEMSKAAAQLAKRAAAEVTRQEPLRPRFVAGVLGPPPCLLSLSPEVSWAAAVEAYEEQARGLADGGADLLLAEAGDGLAARAAVAALEALGGERGLRGRPPLLLGATLAEGGRTPAGQSAEAFLVSVWHAKPLAVGLSSDGGPGGLLQPCQALAGLHAGWCQLCPGAAGFDPETFAGGLLDYANKGLLNFVGGGTDTTPAHIAAVAKQLAGAPVRSLPRVESPCLQLAGLDVCVARPEEGLQVVGSRCTVSGSARFKGKVSAYKATGKSKYLEEALQVCIEQCEQGADILDFNLDSDMASGPATPAKGVIGTFMKMVAAEPKASRVPCMLCSCQWDTIKEGLKCLQGKSIVNGLSLMLGEEEFLRIAGEVKGWGAALVVLAIDKDGQPAESCEEKVRVLTESYRLLRFKLDFPPEDIIFDCQVTMLGRPECPGGAASAIKAMGELRRACPGASFLAGLNNLSLAFRGLGGLRDALHSVFLQHAIPKGLNLAIAWPGALPADGDIDAETRALCEELVLDASADGRHLEHFLAFVRFRTGALACLPLRLPAPVSAASQGEGTAEGSWPARAVRKEARELQATVRAQRGYAAPEEQRAALAAVPCGVRCPVVPLRPAPSSRLPDFCRQDGTAITATLAAAVVARSSPAPREVARHLNAQLRERPRVFAAPASAENREEAYLELFAAGCDVCGARAAAGAGHGECLAAAQAAKAAAAEATRLEPGRPRFVAGVLEVAAEGAGWDAEVACYVARVRGFLDGGADLLALEGVPGARAARAALRAVEEHCEQARRERPPLLVTIDVAEGGATPSGQSLEACLLSLRHARPLAFGVAGPLAGLQAACRALSGLSPCWCQLSASGGEDPDALAGAVRRLAGEGLLNLVGGSGLAPAQVSALAGALAAAPPRPLPPVRAEAGLQLAGLEAFRVRPEGITLVGQRCSMAGSEKFRRLVDAYKYARAGSAWEAAVEVCAEQIAAGAELLDVNFDSERLDSRWAMGKFLRLCAADPRVARVPFVISSEQWPTIEEGLQSAEGKSVVNAISLVQGEEAFLRLARACQRYGAAVVVVTVDTPGEIPAPAERLRIGERAYKLLRTRLDFPAEDIIFDCGVPPVGEGARAKDFIDAVAELKRACPSVSFIAGPGNFSLPFRGAAPLREALHTTLLHHAASVGLNMAFVDPGRLPLLGDIEVRTRKLCDEAVMDASEDGGHLGRLEAYGAYLAGAAVRLGEPAEEAAVAGDLALAVPTPTRLSQNWRQPMRVLVQATGTIGASLFQTFASKSHTALRLHTTTTGCCALDRSVWFSSISAWMGQGGSGPITGASYMMDNMALHERSMGLGSIANSVEWGAIGDIGLRRTIYGSRDVFAQFDLGQKLISPQDTQHLMRDVCVGRADPYEVIGLAYLDQTWQMTLSGVQAGSALEGRAGGNATFAEQ